jgi:hypothetical protein
MPRAPPLRVAAGSNDPAPFGGAKAAMRLAARRLVRFQARAMRLIPASATVISQVSSRFCTPWSDFSPDHPGGDVLQIRAVDQHLAPPLRGHSQSNQGTANRLLD